MKKIIALVLCLIMALGLAACGSGSNDAPAPAESSAPADNSGSASGADDHSDWINVNWSFATFLTETNPFQSNITTLQAYLDDYCDGTIQITTYPSGTLAGMNDMLDALDNGTCDLAYIQLDLYANSFPVSQVMNYPGINYNSALVASKVWHEFQETYPMSEYDGYTVWLWQSSGPSCIFSTSPINSMSDLAGKQFAAPGTVTADILSSWGATPVTVDTSEMYEAIRNSLVDGRIGMFGACAMSNLDEVAKYALVFPMGSYSYVGLAKDELFEGMPESQKEAFMKAVEDTFNNNTIYYQDAGLAGNPRVAECVANVDLKFADGEMLDQMTEACQSMLLDYCAKLTEMGYNGDEIFQTLQDLADKYNQEMTWEQYAECYYNTDYFAGKYEN